MIMNQLHRNKFRGDVKAQNRIISNEGKALYAVGYFNNLIPTGEEHFHVLP
jgi:hypothetical protein